MTKFKVIFTRVAQKDLNSLEPKIRLTVLQACKELQASPFPRGNIIKKLKGLKFSVYRLRTGNFRVVYHIDQKNVVVLSVVDRKNLEKRLKALS